MRTDDDLNDLIGGTLIAIEVRDASDIEQKKEEGKLEYLDVLDLCFMEIKTDKYSVTFSNHVEHNGYYGGFSLDIKEIKEEKKDV